MMFGGPTFSSAEIDVSVVGTPAAVEMSAVWRPGGDHDSNDQVEILKPDGTSHTEQLVYPAIPDIFWDADSRGVAIRDTGESEAFGFKHDVRHTFVFQGGALDGPKYVLTPGGFHLLQFAVKPNAALRSWLGLP